MYLASLQDLPTSLYEAAEIDGANTLQKFTNITVPYLKPITTYVLLTGIIGLQSFQSQNAGTMWNQVMAAACISVLPIIILYLIFNKFFMVGLRMDGEK